MSLPAARVGDHHICPMFDGPKPHVGGPILPPGCLTVLVGGVPAARQGDKALCVGPPDTIVGGDPTVLIGGKPAARLSDMTMHGGMILKFCPTVFMGMGGLVTVFVNAAKVGAAFVKDAAAAKKIFIQEQDYSCVIASSRNMIKQQTGKDIPEKQLRDEMREIMGNPNHDFNKNGINPMHASELLKNHGVDNEVKINQSSSDLENLTSGGKPALVGFPGHRVMLNSVTTDKNGNKTFHVADPASAYK
ncbi:MAG: hypothetical protein GY869_25395, partial [Planctomycetes bacterium]|nr:hypothetical protein [Planctomycetota bacterium]